MRDNPIQFAVVREDPLIEAEVVRNSGAKRILIIGSGGCTALSLQAIFPNLKITLVDANKSQLELIQNKITQLRTSSVDKRKQIFNIGTGDPVGLNACGNFESLFRSFRLFLNEFILPHAQMLELFSKSKPQPIDTIKLIRHKYWPVAFDLHFHDSFLEAMFGNAAVQHAPPGSYPEYFRKVFERGLAAPAASSNYFLHHVLLGFYIDRPDCLPPYLVADVPDCSTMEFVPGTIDSIQNLNSFDLIDLSNIFDWMAESEVAAVAKLFNSQAKLGSQLLYRQLNHAKDFSKFFGSQFKFDRDLGNQLHAKDRSLFYSALNIATKSQ